MNVNQWRNTQNVIDWFGNIEEKTRHYFISFDIIDFCPSISENLLDQALSWASNLASISNEDISIIKHARKSLLFSNGKPWTKNNNSNLFDVTMGIYDGAEICELVGLFILKQLGKTFGNKNIGLYRDDGLAIIKNKSARLADKTRKELHKIFEQFGLKITAEANLHVVNFLDVTFDLTSGKHRPYRTTLYCKTVRTNVARDFPKLIDKHFPKTSPLHKIFNRNTIKVSYSCMYNVRYVISRHNKCVLSEAKAAQESTKKNNVIVEMQTNAL